MDAADGNGKDPPTASRAGAGVPLTYTSDATSDMPWVLRFMGCFIALHNAEPLLMRGMDPRVLLTDFRVLLQGPASWQGWLGLLAAATGVAAGVGISMRRRLALWVAIALCLHPIAGSALTASRAADATECLWKLPVVVVPIWLLVAIYRRAERSEVLVPVRTDMFRAAVQGDDILWLARQFGVYLLLSAMVTVLTYAHPPAGTTVATFWDFRAATIDFPVAITTGLITTAISAWLGIALLLGRYRRLAACACLTLFAPVARDMALNCDYARSGSPLTMLQPWAFWQGIAIDLVNSIVSAGFCIVLYRKARGRFGPSAAEGNALTPADAAGDPGSRR